MTTPHEIVSTRTIASVERGTNSRDGSPRYTVVFTDGSAARTKPDAQVNYKITNPEYQGKPITIVMDFKGQIVAVHEP